MTRTERYVQYYADHAPLDDSWWFSWEAAKDQTLSDAVESCPAAYTTRYEKRAYYESMLLDNMDIPVNEFEILAGGHQVSLKYPNAKWDDAAEFREKKQALLDSGWGSNATGHRVIDFEKLFRLGICGVIREIDSRLAALAPSMPDFVSRRGFYRGCKMAMEAILRFADRYADTLKSAAETASPERKAELLDMAERLSRVPAGPAESFRDALQSMWFVQFCLAINGDITLTGRFDRYMLPFYEKDVAEGILTREDALELIEQLYIKHNELYGAWPASIMVAGVDREGNPVLNDLSYLCIEAIGTVPLVNPAVNVAWRPDLPRDFMDLCLKQIANGRTRPAFFNDDLIIEGQLLAGVRLEDAREYIHSTCVEITPVAASDVLVATPYINLNKAFEYILGDGKQLYGEDCHIEKDLRVPLNSLDSFEAFKQQAFRCAREIIRTHLEDVCVMAYHRKHDHSSPMASPFIRDCLARGKDSGEGGARYSMVYPCFPGYVNFIDTLAAVKKAVYEDKKLTLRELAEQCRDNFTDERMRLYLLNACPKFANDHAPTDLLGEELYALIRDELGKYKTAVGATFHPSFFAWVMHGRLGKIAAALPDGRKQGEALSEHLGAMQGRDKAGPLALVRSISRIPQEYGIGGIATNFRFSVDFMNSPEGKDAVLSLIEEFMAERCFELQFNVVSQKQLLDAKDHPEKYRTLLVRVAGYSDYFVNLDPVIQDEIIKRSEHAAL